MSKWFFFLSLSLILISFFFRFNHLNTVPRNINPDERDNIITYLYAINTGSPKVFGINWNGAPSINIYLIGSLWELTNRSIWGIRLANILISSGVIVSFFLFISYITKKIFLSYILSLLLMINPWFTNFSRSGWENLFNCLPVIGIMAGFCLIFAEKKSKIGLFLLIISSALGFYFYHPGKFFILIVGLLLFARYLGSRKLFHLKTTIIFSIVSLILIVPQLNVMKNENSKAWHRINSVSILNKVDTPNLLKNNLIKNAKGFLFFRRLDFDDGYLNKRYILDDWNPISSVLIPFYIFGLLISLKKYFYIVVFYLLAIFPIEVFSLATPDAARAVHIIPMVYFFIALGVNKIINLTKSRIIKYIVITILMILATGLFYKENFLYWKWISLDNTIEARKPATDNGDYKMWLMEMEQKFER